MSPELIAILITALLQSAMLIVALVMLYRLGKILEHTDGIAAATFLQGRNIQEAIKEANQLMREELARKA